MSRPTESVVIVHYDERGEINFHVFGDERVRLFIIDEGAPDDRVFEWTRRDDPAALREIMPEGCEIGHDADNRHAAIAQRVTKWMAGERHLSAVPTDPERPA